MEKGKFIVFEGGEGAGKTTAIALLADKLREMGIDLITTREPGGTPIAEELRNIFKSPSSKSMTTLASIGVLNASRAQHLDELVRPALAEGKWVICDRYAGSTMAYQYFANDKKDVSLDRIREIHDIFTDGFWPDLTFYLDVAAEIGLARVAASRDATADRFDGEVVDFHEKLRAGYQSLSETESNWVTVDAAKTSEETVQSVIDTILEKFNLENK